MALFAALSYAVTQSSRGGGAGVDQEKAELAAAEIVQYGTSIRTAITRMTIGGMAYASLDFDSGWNNPCSAGANCVFAPEGGGVAWRDTLGGYSLGLDTVNYSVAGVGTAADDDLMQISGMSQNICEAINEGLGLSSNPVATNSGAFFTFDAYPGEEEACLKRTCCGGPYVYYFVLKAK